MQQNLAAFKLKEILNSSLTQKTLFLLGNIEGKQGQAIAVITPQLHNSSNLSFNQITTIFTNDIYGRFTAQMQTKFDIQFIYPITQKHKKKYLKKIPQIYRETGEQYQKKKDQLLKYQLSHLQWVTNILIGKTQTERVLFRDQRFVICQDFKWNDVKDLENMHILVIFNVPQLHSLRQLRGEHVELLQNVQKSLEKVLSSQLNTNLGFCRMYFHYPPTFYRLHIHVMSLSLESLSCRVQRCHDFSLVVQNLKMNGDYYKNITLNNLVQK